ncbi:MAG: HlyC/CorC family transporter [Clostridia bacterium]|nr:HlyC/CorC family transporter [Clostridia bacterium]
MGPALQIVIITVCIILSAYFSATETSFSTFNRIRVKNLAEKGNKKAALAIRLSEDYDTLITTILIGNNIVNILATSISTLLFVGLLKSQDLGATISTIVLTLVILTFGEITPKSMAKKSPEAFVLFSAPIINFFRIILTPIAFVFKCWQKLLVLIFKPSEDDGVTEEELISIIEEAEEEGGLDKEDGELIKSAIEFNDLEVGDIFTPRIDITAVAKDATYDEVSKVFSDSGYSRLPVYDGDIDNITGIVYYKDFYNEAFSENDKLDTITKPVIYVAKTQKINDLLKDLQNKQLHMAIVMDEYGSTAGIVTLEDILEEIVGEIWDEHDEKIEEIKEIGEGVYIVSGMASISKVLDTFDIDEEPDASNANGWAMEVLGKMPETGDSFTEYGLQVEILETNGKRVENMRITDVRGSEDEDEDEKDENDD